MSMLDNLSGETGRKFGIGAAAEPLTRELLQLMTGGPGGLGAFLDRFRNAGMSTEIAALLSGRGEAVLPAKSVDTVLGDSTVASISRRVGLAPAVVSMAAAFEIPKLIALLTPGGRVPAALPTEVQSYVSAPDQMSPMAMTTVSRTEQVAPVAMTTIRETPRRAPWLWPLLILAVVGGLIGFWLTRTPQVTASDLPAAPALPSAARIEAQAPVAAPDAGLDQLLSRTVLKFSTGSAVLPASSEPLLQLAAEQIKSMPAGSVIEIAGHTDNVGDPAANMALSQRRADAVMDALTRDGVSASMLSAKGYGETMPVAPNDTAQGRDRNRRIAFSVVNN